MMKERGFTAAMSVAEAVAPGIAAVEKPFGRALVDLGHARADVCGLTADLGKYTDIDLFAQAFPDRFFQIGMAEQNLIGVAAGLARTGFVPFATTYCVFATRRAYDFIAIDAAYGRANVKIIAGLPGLTTGLWRHPSGHRRPGLDAIDAEHGRHRSLRRNRDRTSGARNCGVRRPCIHAVSPRFT